MFRRGARGGAAVAVAAVLVAGCLGVREYQHRVADVAAVHQRHVTAAKVAKDARSVVASTIGGQPALIATPERPNGRLVIYVHGTGQTERDMVELPSNAAVTVALLRAGYTVGSTRASGNAWGNDRSVSDYEEFATSVASSHHLGRVYLLAESMGGLAAARVAGALPMVRAWAAWYPVCNLATLHGARFGAQIDAAYGRGVRAALGSMSPEPMPSRIPAMFWASPSDTVVPKAQNADLCAAEIRAAGGVAVVHSTRGDHGDPSNFDPAEVVAFFNQA